MVYLGLKSILALAEMDVLLVLALSNKVGLVLSEATTNGAGLLCAHIKRLVLLVLVQLSNLLALLLSHNSQNTSNSLANMATINFKSIYSKTILYILATLLAAPEEIFWTRREASSCLRSESCSVS